MSWEYSDKTKQLFLDAVSNKPGSHLGEIKDYDGLGTHGSIVCGDAMQFSFKVEKNEEDPTKDKIIEAKYLTFGCTSAIASSEALCSILESKKVTPLDALKITNQDIVKYLGGLPSQKIHCSVMGKEALEAAIIDWAKNRGVDVHSLGIELDIKDKEEGEIVCECFNISDTYLKRKVREMNLKTLKDVENAIKAGGACGTCQHKSGGIQDILYEIWGKPGSEEVIDNKSEKSPYQIYKEIEKNVESTIRPMLKKDGGDIEIIDIKDKKVYCTLLGACKNCVGAQMTLKNVIEKTLKDNVDIGIEVIDI